MGLEILVLFKDIINKLSNTTPINTNNFKSNIIIPVNIGEIHLLNL